MSLAMFHKPTSRGDWMGVEGPPIDSNTRNDDLDFIQSLQVRWVRFKYIEDHKLIESYLKTLLRRRLYPLMYFDHDEDLLDTLFGVYDLTRWMVPLGLHTIECPGKVSTYLQFHAGIAESGEMGMVVVRDAMDVHAFDAMTVRNEANGLGLYEKVKERGRRTRIWHTHPSNPSHPHDLAGWFSGVDEGKLGVYVGWSGLRDDEDGDGLRTKEGDERKEYCDVIRKIARKPWGQKV